MKSYNKHFVCCHACWKLLPETQTYLCEDCEEEYLESIADHCWNIPSLENWRFEGKYIGEEIVFADWIADYDLYRSMRKRDLYLGAFLTVVHPVDLVNLLEWPRTTRDYEEENLPF